VAAERLVQELDSTSYTQNRRDINVIRFGTQHESKWGSLRANVRQDRTSDFGSATTGLIGGRYIIGKGFSVLGTVSTSFTPPTFDFLYFDCGPDIRCSNPNLRPERARNIETGLQYENTKTLVRATVFSVRYRDKIANDRDFTPRNLAQVTNEGLELSVRHAIAAWALIGEATYQDPVDESTGKRPLRRAREQLALRADYGRGAWHAGAGLRHVGNRLDVGDVTLGSYTVIDASAHYALTPNWTLAAAFENLFDRTYSPTTGYNGRPRGVFLSASWSSKR
jgi:vitamin B12 transporter